METEDIERTIAETAYARVRPWMCTALGLRDASLLLFALLFERSECRDDLETGRIDGGYISRATGVGPEETVKAVTKLTQQGLVRQELAPDGCTIMLSVDMAGVRARMAESGRKRKQGMDPTGE